MKMLREKHGPCCHASERAWRKFKLILMLICGSIRYVVQPLNSNLAVGHRPPPSSSAEHPPQNKRLLLLSLNKLLLLLSQN